MIYLLMRLSSMEVSGNRFELLASSRQFFMSSVINFVTVYF